MNLEDAAEATKISSEYLQALEENRISQFASLAYLKGFVRIYANSLGLNPDDIIRLYEKMYSNKDQNDVLTDSTVSIGKKGISRFPFQKLMIPAILLLLIIITSVFINRHSPPSRLQQPKPEQPPSPATSVYSPLSSSRMPSPLPEKGVPLNEQKPPVENVMPQKNSTAPSEAQERTGFIVSLKIVRNCSLNVTVDTSAPQQHDMTAGDHIEWQGNDRIDLELSDAGAVEASINGNSLPAFGGEGTHKNITLTKDGIK